MTPIILNDMQSLASPDEIGKLIGTIKEPEQIQYEQKQKYIIYGMLIFGVCSIGLLVIQHFIEENKKTKLNI